MTHIETIRNTDHFCLHDSKISKLEFVDRNLLLTFSEGFWEVNKDGKLFRQRKNCRVTYRFLIAEDEELNLYIFRQTDKKRKEIKFADFSELIKKHGFMIYQEYRSAFSGQMILEGNLDQSNYIIMTDEIDEILYECDDE